MSDDGSIYDDSENIGDADIDELIEADPDTDRDPEVVLVHKHDLQGDINVTVDAILNKDFTDVKPTPTLPPISSKLAAVVTDWMRQAPSRDKVKELFQNTLLPANVPGLKPVRINEVLYQKLPFTAKINDQRLRGINTFLARGLGPLLSCLDKFISLESACLQPNADALLTDTKLKIANFELDVNDFRKKLTDSVKILTAAHGVLLAKRRTNVKPFLDSKFHFLLKDTNTVTELLLGDDLETKINEGSKVMEAARKLSSQFLPRKRERGNRGSYRGRPSRTSHRQLQYMPKFSRFFRHNSTRGQQHTQQRGAPRYRTNRGARGSQNRRGRGPRY